MKNKITYIVLLLFLLSPVRVYASLYDTLPQNIKNQVQSELNYYQKLRTCTPASFATEKFSYQTNGMKNGMCSLDFYIGQGNAMKAACNAPMAETQRFADNKIKYINFLTGIDTNADVNNIMKDLISFSNTYCK